MMKMTIEDAGLDLAYKDRSRATAPKFCSSTVGRTMRALGPEVASRLKDDGLRTIIPTLRRQWLSEHRLEPILANDAIDM